MRIRKTKADMTYLEGIDAEFICLVSDALAHPVRLQLFRYIMQCNKHQKLVCTKDLVEVFDYAQATISQHMKVLEKSGLVTIKKYEKFSHFYASPGVLMKYLDATKHFSVQ